MPVPDPSPPPDRASKQLNAQFLLGSGSSQLYSFVSEADYTTVATIPQLQREVLDVSPNAAARHRRGGKDDGMQCPG
jgi:hypothetical protein